MHTDEPTNRDILETLNSFAISVDERFNGMEKRFTDLRKELKGDIFQLRMETKQDIAVVREEAHQTKKEILTAIDGFAVTQRTFDVELVALRARCERVEAIQDTSS